MIHTHYTKDVGNLHCQFARTNMRAFSTRISRPNFLNRPKPPEGLNIRSFIYFNLKGNDISI